MNFICKNWLHARRNLYICLAVFALATAILVPAASAGVSVSAPVASAVNSPFLLRAQATSCNSQATASMAYSLDSGSDIVFSGATSIDTDVSASDGAHTLRVKAWGNSGAFCETDVAITVGVGVIVSAPTHRVVVNSPFLLRAQAPSCNTQSTSSMAYSFDSGSNTVLSGATSIDTIVSTTSGGHTLRVKAWGNSGAFCETDVALTVGGGVVVSTPSNGATVSSPFNLQAQATTCGGQSTASMAYSLDSNPDNLFQGATSIDTSVTASSGAHILRVKAWGNSGAFCETDLDITVSGGGGGGGGLIPPGNAQSAPADIETLGDYTGGYAACPPGSVGSGHAGATGTNFQLWLTEPDCGTVGNKTGSTSLVAGTSLPGTPPDTNDNGRVYSMTYSQAGGGVRWSNHIQDDRSSTHFQYDIWLYMDSANFGQTMNMELDINQAFTSPDPTALYIFAVQCNLDKGVWQISAPGWVNTDQACTRSQFPAGWHHVQIQEHRGPNIGTDGITYDEVAVDGTILALTCNASQGKAACTATPHSDQWSDGAILPNFQLDGHNSGGGSITAYVDQFVVYRW
jgi:hypothetical protein